MHKSAAILILLAILSFSDGVLAAQESCAFTLSGKVIDGHDRSPLSYATVFVRETGSGAITDSLGHYVLRGLCAGEYTLVFSHVGCSDVEVKVNVQKDMEREVFLEHHEEFLEQVVIKGAHKDRATTQSIDRPEEGFLVRRQGSTTAEMLSGIAGMSMLRTGPNIIKPVLHGLHSNRIAIVGNGVKQEGQQWGSEHAPAVNTFLLSEISVIKGAGGVQYGSDALAGTVLMEPELFPVTGAISGSVGAIGNSNGKSGTLQVGIAAPIQKLEMSGWRVKSSLHRSGDARSPDYFLNNTGAREIASSVDWGIRRWTWGIDVYMSQFHEKKGILQQADFGNTITEENARPFSYTIGLPRQRLEHYLGKASAYYRFDKLGKLNLRYSFQKNLRKEFDNRRSGESDRPILNMDLRTHDGELYVEQHPKGNWRGRFGLQGQYQFNYNIPNTGVTPLIPNYKRYQTGVFLLERWEGARGQIEMGFRYDYQYMGVQRLVRSTSTVVATSHNYHNAAGLLGLSYGVGEWLRLNTTLGTGFKPPTVNELYSDGLHHGSRTFEVGDPALKSEFSVKWVGTVGLQPFDGRMAVEVSGYVNSVLNYIYLAPTGDTVLSISGIFPKFQYLQTNALLAGMDVDVRGELFSGLFMTAQYSFIRGNDRTQDQPLIYMPSDRFRIGWYYKSEEAGRPNAFTFGMEWQYVAEQQRFVESFDFEDPPPAYHMLEVYASYERTLERERKISIAVGVQNAYNSRYKEYLDFFRYYSDQRGVEMTFSINYNF